MTLEFSKHALGELKRRRIPISVAQSVAETPQQIVPDDDGNEIRQSIVSINRKDYLLRLVIAKAETHNVVVTAYRTSKIAKYWVKP